MYIMVPTGHITVLYPISQVLQREREKDQDVIMEAEKSNDLTSASWRNREADGEFSLTPKA